MNDNIYTEDFAEIMQCGRERGLALDILKAWCDSGLPERFYDSGVKFAFNRKSGYVFLINDDYQVCMMNGDKLDIWHTLPYSGEEGFIEDFNPKGDYHPDDVQYLEDQGLDMTHCYQTQDLGDDTYDVFGVNTKNSFNTEPKGDNHA